jgi:MinD-like ATPase involved in chromosome partitioning or flagellar assembly
MSASQLIYVVKDAHSYCLQGILKMSELETNSEIKLALLEQRVGQMTRDQEALTQSIKELAGTVNKLEQTVALQKPWTNLVQHIITALVTGAAAFIWAKGQHQQ